MCRPGRGHHADPPLTFPSVPGDHTDPRRPRCPGLYGNSTARWAPPSPSRRSDPRLASRQGELRGTAEHVHVLLSARSGAEKQVSYGNQSPGQVRGRPQIGATGGRGRVQGLCGQVAVTVLGAASVTYITPGCSFRTGRQPGLLFLLLWCVSGSFISLGNNAHSTLS